MKTRTRALWFAVGALAMLDAVLTAQVLSFIHHAADWRCGTGAAWASTKVTFFSVISAPVAVCSARGYFWHRDHLGVLAKFAVRLPLACYVSLLLAFFVVFRFL